MADTTESKDEKTDGNPLYLKEVLAAQQTGAGDAVGNTASEMAKKLKVFINGEWRDTKSGNYMPVTNSSTGEVMAEAASSVSYAFHADVIFVAESGRAVVP